MQEVIDKLRHSWIELEPDWDNEFRGSGGKYTRTASNDATTSNSKRISTLFSVWFMLINLLEMFQ